MKYMFLLICACISVPHTTTAQSANAEILAVWNLFKTAQPADVESEAWKRGSKERLAKGICISGNCVDGYGISIENARGYEPTYQYEGYFEKGKPANRGVSTTRSGIVTATIGDISIEKNRALYKLTRVSKRGFTLPEIKYFQDLAYAGLKKCDCLTPTYTHPVKVNYTKKYEIRNGFGDRIGNEYESATRTDHIEGLRNVMPENVYVRAFSKRRAYMYKSSDNPVEYFDESFILGPGYSMEEGDFTLIPADNQKKIDVAVLHMLTDNDIGYKEYTRFVGQYALSDTLAALCNEKRPGKGKPALKTGTYTYKVDASTGTTNIKINKGDEITIHASGSVKTSPNNRENDPGGLWALKFSEDDERLITDFEQGCLMASVGNCDWIKIGTSESWTTTCSGLLNITINDRRPLNSSGSFIVEIKIARGVEGR